MKKAFTMAEILLSLTIIGVVAAITLPSLTGNINERTWNTQRKALYARFSQAISLMPALNGYGSGATATETFITNGLAKVLKINNICADNLGDCGINDTFIKMNGSRTSTPTDLYSLNGWFSLSTRTDETGATITYSTDNTNAVAFETQNGESIIAYYNKTCRTEYRNQENLTAAGHVFGYPVATMCLNFFYDLNGKKGPNTIGKDMGFITVFNATDSIVVAPLPSSPSNVTYEGATRISWFNAGKACTLHDSESRLPNIDELSAMWINKDIVNITANADGNSCFWSSSVYNTNTAWLECSSWRNNDTKSFTYNVRCVKR